MDRREFLSLSGASVIGAATLSQCVRDTESRVDAGTGITLHRDDSTGLFGSGRTERESSF